MGEKRGLKSDSSAANYLNKPNTLKKGPQTDLFLYKKTDLKWAKKQTH